ncbi:MAG: protein translocase subunit SecF [Actinomycetota bacterium]|nr:protein translocase subunit SecF [Actinomycetota bacterium]
MKSLAKSEFEFVGRKRIWLSLAGFFALLVAVLLIVKGLNFGIDFKGGTELDIRCKAGISVGKVRGVLSEFGYGKARIQEGGKREGKPVFLIRTPKMEEKERKAILSALEEKAGMESVEQVVDVGPGWGSEVTKQAVIALAIFLVAILLYISVRFEFKMAISAILALFHDVLFTVGVYSLVGREVNPATVIAVLTILGYSLYDTIVVFDRVAENTGELSRQSKMTYSQCVNVSVNQCLVRSINTSLTTLLPVGAILLFGGETLKDFAFALFFGIIAGTYSSIFIAPSLLSIWKEREPKYVAYRESVARKKSHEGRAEKATAALPRQKKAASSAAPTPIPKAREVSSKLEPPTPKPKPKTRVSSSAKDRTKGPGSAKKKKKKKKK